MLSVPATAQSRPADAGRPNIELSATEWDFGEKWSGEPAATVVTISNVGDAPLRIKEVGRDCACLVAKLAKKLLAPGESIDVDITYNTKKPKARPVQRAWFKSNDPDTPSAEVRVTGRVRQIFNINTACSFEFGVLGRDGEAEESVEITSDYLRPIPLKLAPLESDDVALGLETIEEGRRYRLTVKTKPPLSYGSITVKAAVLTDLEFLPELPIRISGFVQPPIAVEPAELLISKRTSRRTLRILRVTSRRKSPLKITGVESSDPSVEAALLKTDVKPAARAATFQTVRVRVSLPPASELPAGGATITIKTDDADIKELTVPVRLRNASRPRKD